LSVNGVYEHPRAPIRLNKIQEWAAMTFLMRIYWLVWLIGLAAVVYLGVLVLLGIRKHGQLYQTKPPMAKAAPKTFRKKTALLREKWYTSSLAKPR